MKEIKLKIYTFDELSEKAKANVCEMERAKTDNYGTFGQEQQAYERMATLDKFCEVFKINYRVEYGGYYFVHWNFEDDIDEGIRGKYLWRFLDKVYYDIRSRKYYGKFVPCEKDAQHPIGQRLVSRYSRIQWEEQNCPFTGVYCDCDILDKIFEWYKKPDWQISLHDLIESCFRHFMDSWERDDEYCMSDEYIADMISNNNENQEYLEDGTEFNGDYEEYVEEVA